MAQTVKITLTKAGTNTDIFSLFSDIDGFLVPFETDILKATLVSGYLSSLVPDGATIIKVKCTGICLTEAEAPIQITTTTTTSTTTSTTSTTTTIPPTTTTSTSTTIALDCSLAGNIV